MAYIQASFKIIQNFIPRFKFQVENVMTKSALVIFAVRSISNIPGRPLDSFPDVHRVGHWPFQEFGYIRLLACVMRSKVLVC